MRIPISLTARLSLLFAGLAAGVLLVAGLLFEHAVKNHFLEHDREELYGKMELIRDLLRTTTSRDALAALPLRLHDAISGHLGIVITVAQSEGTVLSSIGDAAVAKHLLEGAEITKPQPVVWSQADHTYRIVANHLALGIPASQPAKVAIALDTTDDQEFFAEFRGYLWFGMAQAALAMGFLGWLAVRSGLSPLHKVSITVATVSA
jgi:two-component system heavy metal sensor histidine kinase CusS